MVVPFGLRLVGLVLLGLVAVVPVAASATQPERFLTRAVFADGRLWILSDAGVLSSIAEEEDAWVKENFSDPVFDLCVQDGQPTVITGKRERATTWTLRRRVKDTWSVEATVQTEGDALVVVDCAAERTTLLTTRRLIDMEGITQRAVVLSGKLNPGFISSAYSTSDQFFVGINAGEWGGGLHHIDRHSGTITPIERNATGELCGGPLNSSCDPVNGIASVPWKPDCIAAAIGLAHMLMHGRVVEICGDQVERLYDRPYESAVLGSNVEMTIAFYGLTREADTLWAVGVDGIYRIEQDGTGHFTPMPEFKEIGRVKVSFELSRFIVVDRGLSPRGGAPMLVSR